MVVTTPRVTPTPRLPALDGLRAIAALAVVAVHVAFNTGRAFEAVWGGVYVRLDAGVAIFFVLSGFLLFRPFALARASGSPSPSMARYLRRRALRILPAYWLVVVVVLIVLPQNRGTSGRVWLEYLSLTFLFDVDSFRIGLNQTWSLAVEVVFYLALPLLVVVALGRRWRPGRAIAIPLTAGLVLSGGWLVWLANGLTEVSLAPALWMPPYAIWFVIGTTLACVHVGLETGTIGSRWRVLDRMAEAPLACWSLAGGLLLVAGTPLAGPRAYVDPMSPIQLATRLVLEAAIAALMLIPLAFGPPTQLKIAMSGGPVRWLGSVSYGLFLWHIFVLETIYWVKGWPYFTGDFLTVYLLTVALSLVPAAASYYLMERPLLRLGEGRGTDRQPQRSDGPEPEQLGSGVDVVAGAEQDPGTEAEGDDGQPLLGEPPAQPAASSPIGRP